MNAKPKRLILGYIPNNKCNLKCEYCYYTQREIWKTVPEIEFQYSVDHMIRCLSAERLGGVCLINLTGQGETLLQKGIVELVEGLLKEGHYVEIVTNGIARKVIDQILAFDPELLAHVEFKISFHYNELLRRGLLEQFFETIENIRKTPCSFSLELMPYDQYDESIDDIQKLCLEKVGAKCHVTVGRDDSYKSRSLLTDHTREQYLNNWLPFDSDMFQFKMQLLDVKRREFCYAGCWTLFINMATGDACPCYGMPFNQNVFKNPQKPISFVPVGHYCTEPYCVNGHAHLSLGAIPELSTPTYADIRNRKCADGREWFAPECRRFFEQKLYDNNKQYSKLRKLGHTAIMPFRMIVWSCYRPRATIDKLKRFLYLKAKT